MPKRKHGKGMYKAIAKRRKKAMPIDAMPEGARLPKTETRQLTPGSEETERLRRKRARRIQNLRKMT